MLCDVELAEIAMGSAFISAELSSTKSIHSYNFSIIELMDTSRLVL
jgi:hypothetical protein